MEQEKQYRGEEDNDEIDLMDYVKIILKRKILIITLFILAVIASGVFSFLSPKVYKIDTVLEIGEVDSKTLLENPGQLMEKLKAGSYKVLIMDELDIQERNYPEVIETNPKDTNLIIREIESIDTQKAKLVLEKVNELILTDHQKIIKTKADLIKQNIKEVEEKIKLVQSDIERLNNKIENTEEEKESLEDKIKSLEQQLIYDQTPGTQYALFNTKQELSDKKNDIENLYLKVSSIKRDIEDYNFEIESLKSSLEKIKPTKIIKSPTISEDPVKPRPMLNMAIAGVLGLLVGIFWAIGREWWRETKVKQEID